MCQNVCRNKQQQRGSRLVDKLRGPRGGAALSRVTVLMIFKVRLDHWRSLFMVYPKNGVNQSEQLNCI